MLRGAFTLSLPNVPTRRASEKVGSNKTKSILILSQRKTQKF